MSFIYVAKHKQYLQTQRALSVTISYLCVPFSCLRCLPELAMPNRGESPASQEQTGGRDTFLWPWRQDK